MNDYTEEAHESVGDESAPRETLEVKRNHEETANERPTQSRNDDVEHIIADEDFSSACLSSSDSSIPSENEKRPEIYASVKEAEQTLNPELTSNDFDESRLNENAQYPMMEKAGEKLLTEKIVNDSKKDDPVELYGEADESFKPQNSEKNVLLDNDTLLSTDQLGDEAVNTNLECFVDGGLSGGEVPSDFYKDKEKVKTSSQHCGVGNESTDGNEITKGVTSVGDENLRDEELIQQEVECFAEGGRSRGEVPSDLYKCEEKDHENSQPCEVGNESTDGNEITLNENAQHPMMEKAGEKLLNEKIVNDSKKDDPVELYGEADESFKPQNSEKKVLLDNDTLLSTDRLGDEAVNTNLECFVDGGLSGGAVPSDFYKDKEKVKTSSQPCRVGNESTDGNEITKGVTSVGDENLRDEKLIQQEVECFAEVGRSRGEVPSDLYKGEEEDHANSQPCEVGNESTDGNEITKGITSVGDEKLKDEQLIQQEDNEVLLDRIINGAEYDLDQVRNYGSSILAIAESSRATRLHERFQSGREGMKGKKSSDASIDADSSPATSSEDEQITVFTKGPQRVNSPAAAAQLRKQASLPIMQRKISGEDFTTPDSLKPATIRRDGLAVEPDSKESGINHYKISISKEMQEAIEHEKCRLDSVEGQGGIVSRVSKGVGSYLAQRRERRDQLALERKIAEANRALEEMRRLSDSTVSVDRLDLWGDPKVEVEPEPPTKFHPVPAILTKSLIAEFVKSYLPASISLLKWKRIYSLSRDGDSFLTFLANVDNWQKTLLVVRTNREDLFGAYCDDAWGGQKNEMEAATFYGSGQSFLFKITTAKSEDVSFAPHNSNQETEQIVAFKWTGANRYVQLCDPHKKLIAMGGGGVTGSFGLCLEDDFSVGSSGPCETFGNEPLATQDQFDILDLEVWGFMNAF